MAFTQFYYRGYWRVLDTDTNTGLGYFNLQDATDLKHVMLTAYVNGIIASAFTLRLNIYGSSAMTTPLYSSDWATLSSTTLINNDTGLAYTQNWIGTFYLDFDGCPLNSATDYYYSVQTSGYTRNANTFYIGINLDWPSPVNTQLDGPGSAGARIRIVGKR